MQEGVAIRLELPFANAAFTRVSHCLQNRCGANLFLPATIGPKSDV